jgi:hypothetical protein
MKRLAAFLFLAVAYLASGAPAPAQFNGCPPGFCSPPVASTGCANSGHAAAFLARAGSLDALHTAAYTRLLDGLDTDTISCQLDVLHVYATQNSTVALLNLLQNTYNGTANGSFTFTADRGYSGQPASSTTYINTGFNSTTATSPHYTQNSAHMSSWSLIDSAFTGYNLGTYDGSTSASLLTPKQSSDTQSYFHIQAGPSGFADGVTTTAVGHFSGNRIDSSSIKAYYNGVLFGTSARTSTALNNLNVYSLGHNNAGTPVGNGQQQAMISIGSALSATDSEKFYNRLCNYMADVGVPGIAPGTTVPGTEVATFLARTSGLDGTHITAYTNLINGLVTDGVWPKLDVLHIYATQDSKTSLLNLVSCAYTGINSGATFTADRGWQGIEDGSNYIDTQFNATTAQSPKYVQNSAHISIWGTVNNGFSFDGSVGANDGTTRTEIFPWLRSDGNLYFRVNGGSIAGITNIGTTAGYWLANRSSSSRVDGYRNGSSIFSNTSTTSSAPANFSINTIAVNDNGTHRGNGTQAAAATIGSSLSAGDVTNLYNRLRTYMTAVGVP